MINWRVFWGKKNTFYFGNQMEGRVRDFLRERFDLDVENLRYAVFGNGGGKGCFLVVWFHWDGPPSDRLFFPVEVINSQGDVLDGVYESRLQGTNPYLWTAMLSDLEQTNGPFEINLGLANTQLVARVLRP